jgi:UMF1 family MFS transporter
MEKTVGTAGASKLKRKAIFGWALYDWANSAFATTVMAGFFPVFFKQYWNTGTDVNVSTARLGLANSLASIIIVLLAPLLGACADQGSAKKKFLIFFTFLGVTMTAGLALVGEGHWLAAASLYVLALIGFSGGNIFYDSLLPAVAPENKYDIVSALGYALGYLGGGLLFAVNVWMTVAPRTFGLADAGAAIRVSFLTAGVWWALFALPLLYWVREPAAAVKRPVGKIISAGLKQLYRTLAEIRQARTIFLFLLAYWFYIDGVDTIIRMAVDYGMALGFEANALLAALLITQFIGFPAALAFGYLGEKTGARRAIFIAIGLYLGITVWGALMKNKNEFYLLAGMVGLVQGGIQALSRSYYARLIPADKTAEYFGFYNMLGKFAAVIGPVLMGLSGLAVRKLGGSSAASSRISLLSVALLFLAGGILLHFVRPGGRPHTSSSS